MTSTTTTSATTPLNYPYAGYVGGTDNFTTTGTDMGWDQKEKELLANVGFKYNKKTNCWELNLTAIISIPQSIKITEFVDSHKPCDRAIKIIKELKERLIKKLTAKMILIELSKPREIKE